MISCSYKSREQGAGSREQGIKNQKNFSCGSKAHLKKKMCCALALLSEKHGVKVPIPRMGVVGFPAKSSL